MFELFKLFGRLFVDNSGANQALDETGKKAEHTTSELGQYAEKLKKWAVGLLTVSSAVSGLKKVWEISSQVADLGDSIDKSSQKFLLSRAAYQEWAFVAEHSGFSIEQLGNAVVDLSKKVGQGSDDVLTALEEIGISAADAMTATPEELFDMVIAGLQGMENSTRKAYVADKLLGGAAKDLGPLLNANAEDTAALRDRLGELGGKMSDTLIDSSAAYGDALTDLNTAWQGVKNGLAEDTVPAMTDMVNGLTEMLTGDFIKGLEAAADGVEEYLKAVVNHFYGFFQPLSDKIAEWTAGLLDKIPGMNATETLGLIKKGTEDGKTWWEEAGYIGNPVILPGNAEEEAALFDNVQTYGTTFDAAQWAFNLYKRTQAGDRMSDLLDMLEEKYGTANMDAAYDAYERLIEKIESYTAAGGEMDEFWAQMRETYGSAVDGCAEAVNGAADTWNQSAADVSAASSRAVAAMDAAGAQLGAPYATGDHPGRAAKFAVGLDFVPRDDFPARLHYGERVLTRQENAAYSAGQTGGNITINIQTTAQSPAQTAAAIQAALARARWAM